MTTTKSRAEELADRLASGWPELSDVNAAVLELRRLSAELERVNAWAVDYHKEMRTAILAKDAELERVKAEREGLKRGEFICQKCGLRKDAEHESQPSF